MGYWLHFAMVIAFVICTDACWAMYIITTGEKKALASSIWAVLIYFLSAQTIFMYMEDHSFMWAALIGAFIGTYVTIKFVKKK